MFKWNEDKLRTVIEKVSRIEHFCNDLAFDGIYSYFQNIKDFETNLKEDIKAVCFDSEEIESTTRICQAYIIGTQIFERLEHKLVDVKKAVEYFDYIHSIGMENKYKYTVL